MVYRRSFEIPSSFWQPAMRLQFEATDYYADAWLNGARLGRHEGYMDQYEYDVGSQARVGAQMSWSSAPGSVITMETPLLTIKAVRRSGSEADDITPLGITRPVRLVASDPLS